jgi:hypothetical protein
MQLFDRSSRVGKVSLDTGKMPADSAGLSTLLIDMSEADLFDTKTTGDFTIEVADTLDQDPYDLWLKFAWFGGPGNVDRQGNPKYPQYEFDLANFAGKFVRVTLNLPKSSKTGCQWIGKEITI